MGLKEDFNTAGITEECFRMLNPITLAYTAEGYYSSHKAVNIYDFLARHMVLQDSKDGSINRAIPFSQLDPESLEFMRDKLIELGGKPPALPQKAKTAKAKQETAPKPVPAFDKRIIGRH